MTEQPNLGQAALELRATSQLNFCINLPLWPEGSFGYYASENKLGKWPALEGSFLKKLP
jgi:hypothetical protein